MSIKIQIDLSDLHKVRENAKKRTESIGKVMLNAVRMGAYDERQNHKYQNRTGNLEKSTKGNMVRDGAKEKRVELRMGEDYASSILQKGLTGIDDEARLIERQLQAFFEHLYDGI